MCALIFVGHVVVVFFELVTSQADPGLFLCAFSNALLVHSFGASHLVNVCYNVGCVALLCLLRHLDGL